MKIKTDYDLLKEIEHSKKGIKANEYFINTLKNNLPLSIGNLGLLIYSMVDMIRNEEIKNNLIFIAINIGGHSLIYGLCDLFSKKGKIKVTKEADDELQRLVTQLYNLEVRTDLELLKKSKLNQTSYKIVFTDGNIKLPRLKQYKYIDVPLSNGYEETILQEHVFGDEDYEISVKSPEKKTSMRLVKQM